MSDLEIHLPVLVLREILRYFSLSERIRFRRISKAWKFAVGTIEPQRDLCVYTYEYPYPVKWPFSNEEVACEQMLYCDYDHYNPQKFIAFKCKLVPFLQELKRIFLYNVHRPHALLEHLSLFTKLEVLAVQAEEPYEMRKLQTIRSTSLEKISLTFKVASKVYLELDTPNLSSLILWGDKARTLAEDHVPSVRFRYPLKLKHLECITFDRTYEPCKNLETIVCQLWHTFEQLWAEIDDQSFGLKGFESLKMINIFPADRSDPEVRLRAERDRLGRENLKIYAHGSDRIRIYYDACSYYKPLPGCLRMLTKNRSEFIGSCPWEMEFDFAALYRFFRCSLRDLHAIFRRIVKITIGPKSKSVEFEASNVINFLKEINPSELVVGYSFKREFYEQLPMIQSIKELQLDEPFGEIDYASVLKLKNLLRIQIFAATLPIEFVWKCFKRLKYFQALRIFLDIGTVRNICHLKHLKESSSYSLHLGFSLKDSIFYRCRLPEWTVFTKECEDFDELIAERYLENVLVRNYDLENMNRIYRFIH